MKPLRSVGLAIADARVAKLWNQTQLAAAVGCSVRQVSRWERGEQAIGLGLLSRVAAAQGVGFLVDAIPLDRLVAAP